MRDLRKTLHKFNRVWRVEFRFIFYTLLISFAFMRHRKQVYNNIY